VLGVALELGHLEIAGCTVLVHRRVAAAVWVASPQVAVGLAFFQHIQVVGLPTALVLQLLVGAAGVLGLCLLLVGACTGAELTKVCAAGRGGLVLLGADGGEGDLMVWRAEGTWLLRGEGGKGGLLVLRADGAGGGTLLCRDEGGQGGHGGLLLLGGKGARCSLFLLGALLSFKSTTELSIRQDTTLSHYCANKD
jgi:hypothetical protein